MWWSLTLLSGHMKHFGIQTFTGRRPILIMTRIKKNRKKEQNSNDYKQQQYCIVFCLCIVKCSVHRTLYNTETKIRQQTGSDKIN